VLVDEAGAAQLDLVRRRERCLESTLVVIKAQSRWVVLTTYVHQDVQLLRTRQRCGAVQRKLADARTLSTAGSRVRTIDAPANCLVLPRRKHASASSQ
jgi:hypothetical protein